MNLFCVATNPSLPSDIAPAAKMKTSCVHLPSAATQNQMCRGFDVDQPFYSRVREEQKGQSGALREATTHTHTVLLGGFSAQASHTIVKNVNSLTL